MASRGDYKDRFAQALEHSGLGPHSIAEKLGISYQAVMKVINGTTGMLRADNNSVAAKAMRVNSDWLATGEGTRDLHLCTAEAENLARLCDQIKDARERERFLVIADAYASYAIKGQLGALLDMMQRAFPASDTKPVPHERQSLPTASGRPKQI